MNRDFVEMLSALSEAGADFIIVSAHALATLGIPRTTGDIDIWVRPTQDNAARVITALSGISGVTFEDAWKRRTIVTLEGIQVGMLSREDFIANKRAAGRPKDLLDLALLDEADRA